MEMVAWIMESAFAPLRVPAKIELTSVLSVAIPLWPMTAYEERREKARKLAELKRKMDVKVQQLQQTAIYELLSEKDPELAALLNEFKTIQGGGLKDEERPSGRTIDC